MQASNADVSGHLDSALNSDTEPDVEEYYGHLQDYTKMVANGFKNALDGGSSCRTWKVISD